MTTLATAYLGRSQLTTSATGAQVSLAPNLAREAVAFDAPLRFPLRFREAVSALHDLVIGDLRPPRRDRSDHDAFRAAEQRREQRLRAAATRAATEQALQRAGFDPELLDRFARERRRYWSLRDQYSGLLQREDPALWRMLTPCDPIVTVADDACLFEGFSVDESAYGCLSVQRETGFGSSPQLQLGTTNVDYSPALYQQFQHLRSYRSTRFLVDPQGFTVKTAGNPDYREEKIELPAGWLRGLMQVQVAAGMPTTAVELPREVVYSLLAFLRRHRERQSPRALRFELIEGQPPVVVLEPWGERIVGHGAVHRGPSIEPIRIWGRRRLLVLARALPLCERITVHLLGTGLPSFWLLHMGEMTLTVGLSGWTSNDWTRGSALDQLRPPMAPAADAIAITAGLLQQRRALTRAQLLAASKLPKPELAAALDHLAHSGQTLFDLATGQQRFRSILPQPLGEAQIGERSPEATAADQLLAAGKVAITGQHEPAAGRRFATGKVGNQDVELLIDADGMLTRGRCRCSHHRRFGLRNGACRHLLALRQRLDAPSTSPPRSAGTQWAERWFR